MADKFVYDIDGVKYKQTPIVLGQAIQLSKELAGLDGMIADLTSFINIVGDKLPTLMAIVLTPEGVRAKDKDIAELAEMFEGTVDLETTEQVISDFFVCNPITSLLERIEKATGIIGEIAGKLMLKFFSTAYASSLQEATSPSEMTSSGDSPLKK